MTIPAVQQEGKATYLNSLDIIDTGDSQNMSKSESKTNHFTDYSRTKISPGDCSSGIFRVEEGRQEEGAGEREREREKKQK